MRKLLTILLVSICSQIAHAQTKLLYHNGKIYSHNGKLFTNQNGVANTKFRYTVDNTTGLYADQNFKILAFTASGWNVSVNWGDGTSTTRAGDSSSYTLDHVYSSNSTYDVTVSVIGDSSLVRQIFFNNNSVLTNITSIKNITYFPKLDQFNLLSANIASVNSFVYNPILTHITITGDKILTNFDPATALPSGLTFLRISGCGGGTAAGTGVFPAFHPTINLPATLTTITLSSNNWDSTEVNTTLIYLNSQTFTNPVTINVKQFNPNSVPTGAGRDAENALITKGNTVITD